MLFMANRYLFSPSPHRDYCFNTAKTCNLNPSRHDKSHPSSVLFPSPADRGPSFNNTLVFQAVRLLGPPARFEASKLRVVFKGEETDKYTTILPRTYSLSHCDFTANLTLTISNIIQLDQLKGWYNEDDVVAQWTLVNGDLFLDVHCYVSGPNSLLDLAAEFRYHIFSKELPLVLKAVLYGDSVLFSEHGELMDALVRVYFHSSSKKYNRVEYWGPLKDAAQGRQEYQIRGVTLGGSREGSSSPRKRGIPKSLFQALFTFLM